MVTNSGINRSKGAPGWKNESLANSIVIPISGWSVWGMGLPAEEPDVRFIDPLLRRRLSPMDRAALHVANNCLGSNERVQLIFASRHGELNRSTKLLTEIARGDLPSPMGFCLSVLNAVPGLYGIARQDTSPSTAMSAGEATFAMALIEAASQAWRNPDVVVLLVCADDPPPLIYADQVQWPRDPYAIAIRVEAMHPAYPVRCTWSAAERCEDTEDTEDAIHCFMSCLTGEAATRWSGPDHIWHWQRVYGQV
jgi:hypothetical protein